jgi:DnaJ-domain-containing protein 1
MREADIRKPGLPPNQALGYSDPLSAATMKKRAAPLSLSGIRIDGAPHEVLGISTSATEQQVQAAYRELMKQYHPDKIGRPGTREWTDAQKIAEALNHARAQMIAHLQSQSPKRSGR